VGVSNIRPVRFTVTFNDRYADRNVDGMLRTNFIGLGEVYQGQDARVVVLRPFPKMYDATKSTLEELREVGALSFVEEFL
jgi:hypothetical protein